MKLEVDEKPKRMALSIGNMTQQMKLKSSSVHGTQSYNELNDKPTLNGVVIQGDMFEIDPTVSDWAKALKKPSYNAKEVGAVAEDELNEIGMQEMNLLWEEL